MTATQEFADAVAATSVDERVWTGAFATNVWGGRYAIDGVLGQGGQGCTFGGVDLKTGARVAVKVLDLKAAKDWKAIELFEREVATLKTLTHPALPTFLDVLKDDETGARALVMTQMPGLDLDRVVKAEGPLGEAALWRALIDVADVLAAMHGRASPLMHRDVKPKNLVRRPDGTIAVVDLGGVGHVRGAAGSTVVGTFGYMAPEQLYGTQTPATDLYALGATMLTLATGREPEDQPRQGLALDVDQAAPHLSTQLRTVLKRLLSPDPSARPVDARVFLGELNVLADQRSARAPAPEVEDGAARPLTDGDVASTAVLAALQVMVGIGGSVAVVAFGQVLIPLILTLIIAFTNDATQKARLQATKRAVHDAARRARQGFAETTTQGAASFDELERRERAKGGWGKHARKAEKARRRAERRSS